MSILGVSDSARTKPLPVNLCLLTLLFVFSTPFNTARSADVDWAFALRDSPLCEFNGWHVLESDGISYPRFKYCRHLAHGPRPLSEDPATFSNDKRIMFQFLSSLFPVLRNARPPSFFPDPDGPFTAEECRSVFRNPSPSPDDRKDCLNKFNSEIVQSYVQHPVIRKMDLIDRFMKAADLSDMETRERFDNVIYLAQESTSVPDIDAVLNALSIDTD